MSDFANLAWERTARIRVRDTLRSMCCDILTFMWDNSLLVAREEWTHTNDRCGLEIYARQLVGFRVTRQFWVLKRDQILYKCPFCATELILPLGYMTPDNWLVIPLSEFSRGIPALKISKTLLERELAETKKRSRSGWPPRDA